MVGDALQILRSLVGLPNIISGTQPLPAGVAEAGGTADDIRIASRILDRGADGMPRVGDALQILRFLVRLSTFEDWGAAYN
jgi:hypothetical protein